MTTDINGDYRAAYTYGLEEIGVEDLMDVEGKPNNPLYYLQDAIGSITAITNMNSEVIDSNRFAPYGEALDPVAKNARLTNSPYGLTGEMHDIEGDLVYLRARYYSPDMMRFIQQDTYLGDIKEPLSRNLYAYANDNPLKYVDPSGHRVEMDHETGDPFLTGLKVQANKAILKKGSKGDYVMYLQILLNAKGIKLSADGDFGSLTLKAVINFQESKELATDGIVGPKTWRALESPKQVTPKPPVTKGTATKSTVPNSSNVLGKTNNFNLSQTSIRGTTKEDMDAAAKWEAKNKKTMPGDFGDGAFGKAYDVYISTGNNLAEWQDQNPEFMNAIPLVAIRFGLVGMYQAPEGVAKAVHIK